MNKPYDVKSKCYDGRVKVQLDELNYLMNELYFEHPKPVFDYACILLNKLISDVDNLTHIVEALKINPQSKYEIINKFKLNERLE